jgi:hypothetical protein
MSMLKKLKLRLRALFFKSKMEEELNEEVRFHLEREIEENIARGMSLEEARFTALRSFGGVERIKEESRDERGIRLVEEVWQDLLRFSYVPKAILVYEHRHPGDRNRYRFQHGYFQHRPGGLAGQFAGSKPGPVGDDLAARS